MGPGLAPGSHAAQVTEPHGLGASRAGVSRRSVPPPLPPGTSVKPVQVAAPPPPAHRVLVIAHGGGTLSQEHVLAVLAFPTGHFVRCSQLSLSVSPSLGLLTSPRDQETALPRWPETLALSLVMGMPPEATACS